jgi:hypothetical protein
LTRSFSVNADGIVLDPPNKINVDRLLSAIAACPPQGAIDLVYDMLSCAELHIIYRIEALIYYVDFTGKIPKKRRELIKAYFSFDREKAYAFRACNSAKANDLKNLTQRNLVNLVELLCAAHADQMGLQTFHAIYRWPNTQQDQDLIVSETIITVGLVIKESVAISAVDPQRLNGLVSILIGFELTPREKKKIDTLLQQAITYFKTHYADRHYHVADINQLRIQLDLLHEIKDPSEMYARDAMKIHWKQQKITWQDAAQALVDARVIPNLSYLERLESTRNIKGNIPSIGLLHDLLKYDDQDQQKACICMLSQDKDNEYEFEPFEWLISLLRHPEVVIRQISEVEDVQKTYIDLSDMTEHATADPRTYYFECQQQDYKFTYLTWGERSQTPSIIRAFNLLLQKLVRVERCYEIDAAGVNDSRMFFVADRFKYPEMQQYLRLPSWEVD